MDMRISIWTNYWNGLSPEDALIETARCGYRYAELSTECGETLLTRGNPDKIGAAHGKLAKDQGIDIMQGHLMLQADILNQGHIEALKAWIDLFLAVGVRNMVLHYGTRPAIALPPATMLGKRVDALAQLLPRLDGTQARICLENLSTPHDRDGSLLINLVDALGSEHMGVCLDTGHLNLSGGDPAAFITAVGDRLHALHIADNEGFYDQHLMPYGRGTVDWTGFMRALKANGYTGAFNYEIPGESRAPLEIRREKLIYLRKVAEYMGTVE